LNDYEDVSPETKAKVKRVAEELGYTPNIIAQRLQKQRTDTLGFIMPTYGPRFSDPFFSEFLAGIGNQAAQHGFDLLVSTRPPGEEEMKAYHKHIRSPRVDGFIVVRTRKQDSRIDFLRKKEIPFVAFGRTDDQCDYVFVDEDGEHGMRLIAHHLADLGHERIAFIAAPDHFMFAHHRKKGFREGLAERGLSLDESLIATGNMTQRGGYKQAERLLDLPTLPTAIAACNDLMALGAISAAQKAGLDVGKDIAITGFDNIPLAQYCHPPLTTVHQPIYQIGVMVTEMLIKRIRKESLEEKHVILKPELIARESSLGAH
jgi:LacI family transcriptional regulator